MGKESDALGRASPEERKEERGQAEASAHVEGWRGWGCVANFILLLINLL